MCGYELGVARQQSLIQDDAVRRHPLRRPNPQPSHETFLKGGPRPRPSNRARIRRSHATPIQILELRLEAQISRVCRASPIERWVAAAWIPDQSDRRNKIEPRCWCRPRSMLAPFSSEQRGRIEVTKPPWTSSHWYCLCLEHSIA